MKYEIAGVVQQDAFLNHLFSDLPSEVSFIYQASLVDMTV